MHLSWTDVGTLSCKQKQIETQVISMLEIRWRVVCPRIKWLRIDSTIKSDSWSDKGGKADLESNSCYWKHDLPSRAKETKEELVPKLESIPSEVGEWSISNFEEIGKRAERRSSPAIVETKGSDKVEKCNFDEVGVSVERDRGCKQ